MSNRRRRRSAGASIPDQVRRMVAELEAELPPGVVVETVRVCGNPDCGELHFLLAGDVLL